MCLCVIAMQESHTLLVINKQLINRIFLIYVSVYGNSNNFFFRIRFSLDEIFVPVTY